MSITDVPDFQDEVKHKTAEVSGTVIAVYTKNDVELLDVKVGDRVYYDTPADNWEVIIKYEE